MNPNPPMYVLHTLHEHLGSFHCLIFYLKLTRELLFFIFAGSCCHNGGPLCAKVSSPQYTVFVQPAIEIPRISYCIWDVSQAKYIIHDRGR